MKINILLNREKILFQIRKVCDRINKQKRQFIRTILSINKTRALYINTRLVFRLIFVYLEWETTLFFRPRERKR